MSDVEILTMTAEELVITTHNAVRALGDYIQEQAKEIEVLTTERDNALYRVEELEMRNAELALTLHDIQEHS